MGGPTDIYCLLMFLCNDHHGQCTNYVLAQDSGDVSFVYQATFWPLPQLTQQRGPSLLCSVLLVCLGFTSLTGHSLKHEH